MLLAAGCHKAPFKHRRQLLCAAQRGARRAARRLYWGTFVPLRLMLARAHRLHWGTFVPLRLMLARARRLYWGTFVPLRLMLYPGLLVKFWLVLDGFPLYERLLVVACQFLLCCFNVGAAPPAARCRRGRPLPPQRPSCMPQRAAPACARCRAALPASLRSTLTALFAEPHTLARPVKARAFSKCFRNTAHCSVVARAVRPCLRFGWCV
jgi:hypothetical protein